MSELRSRMALVTGSSRGIGNAIAQALARAGCTVAVNGRNEADVHQAAAGLPGAVAVPGDVTSLAEARRVVDTVVERLGKLDILVCNVGSGKSVPPGAETHDEWQRVFALNLWSVTNMVEAARAELALTQGAIVCVSSICGNEVIPGAPVTYSAAKAALNSFVRGVSRPLGVDKVRINAVAAGNVLFPGSTWERKLEVDADGVARMLEANVSLARLGTPDEIADVVRFLCSDEARFVTGAIWTVDGGQVRA
jgi:3-oxoacyl-[acyl-carrier protein] reductase